MRDEVASLWSRLRWPVSLLALVLAYGTVGYLLFGGWSFLDALYMTLTTLTTVGFREVRPLGTGEKIFTMSVIVFGVSTLLVTVSLLAAGVAEGALSERSRRRRMERRVKDLSNHFIICAYGRVGRTVAREFQAEGVPFVVIESREDVEDELIEDRVPYVLGDSVSEEALRIAGLERARGLVCAVDSDATNVYIALMARSSNPDIYIVGRASEAGAAERLYKAGADRVISPYVTSGRHMATLALRPNVIAYLDMTGEESRPLRLEEVQVGSGSGLIGKSVQDVCGPAIPLAIRRPDGEVEAPANPDHRLQAGDLLFLLGEKEVLRPLEGD
ncbi:MAG: potassium channel protein [Actinomycetota bacterium]|nr:potassium channel protein [Actinomycetota bacterium]